MKGIIKNIEEGYFDKLNKDAKIKIIPEDVEFGDFVEFDNDVEVIKINDGELKTCQQNIDTNVVLYLSYYEAKCLYICILNPKLYQQTTFSCKLYVLKPGLRQKRHSKMIMMIIYHENIYVVYVLYVMEKNFSYGLMRRFLVSNPLCRGHRLWKQTPLRGVKLLAPATRHNNIECK